MGVSVDEDTLFILTMFVVYEIKNPAARLGRALLVQKRLEGFTMIIKFTANYRVHVLRMSYTHCDEI
jgi:hypothetical protein